MAHSADDAGDVGVLTEGVGVGTGAALTLLLDVDLDDGTEAFKVLPQIRRRHVLLQVADEQRPRRFRVVLVQVGFQRPEFVVVDVQPRVPRRHFDLAAEEELVARHFQRLVYILRLLESINKKSIKRCNDKTTFRYYGNAGWFLFWGYFGQRRWAFVSGGSSYFIIIYF